jgi:dienelactone hydrolase
MRFALLILTACALASMAISRPSAAQTGTLLDNHKGYTPVSFDGTARSEIGAFTAISNVTFRPQGDGPFPAAILVHTCGGLRNDHIRIHARELLAGGFVVLIQDSHGPRGFQTCRERQIPFAVGLMDAYAGLNHLASLPFVDAARIYLGGYSYGGFVAMLAASPRSATTFRAERRFRAGVAHYANCIRPSGARTLLDDTDRPLLLLFGDRDTETPMASCFPLVEELRGKGAPLAWHSYPGATHAWDKQGEIANGYVFDRDATRDATRRMIDFFNQHR